MRTVLVLLLAAFSVSVFPAPQSPEERGWAVLEKALKAAGGREKLASVKDFSFEFESNITGPQGKVLFHSRNACVLPDTVRQDMTTPFGPMTVAFNAAEGWRKTPRGVEKIPADQVRRTQDHLARVNVLFRPPADRSKVKWIKTETVEGRTCDVIELTHLGDPLRLYVDQATGDVIKRAYRVENPGGGMANVEEFLSDFRAADGIRQHYKLREMRDGQLARDATTLSIRFNSGLKAEELLREFRSPR